MARWFKSYQGRDGSWTTREWSSEEMMNFQLFQFVVGVIIAALVSSFISVVCHMIRLSELKKTENEITFGVFGALTSLYFLIDYSNGWWASSIVGYFNECGGIKTFVALNWAMLIVNLVFLFFGARIYDTYKMPKNDYSKLHYTERHEKELEDYYVEERTATVLMYMYSFGGGLLIWFIVRACL